MDEKTSFEDLCCVLEKEKIFPLRKVIENELFLFE